MARDNLSVLEATAREIDFVTRFGDQWKALQQILGISNAIKKTPGTVLRSKKGKVSLQSGSVNPGDLIPYSKAEIEEKVIDVIDIDKYSKGVPIESIKEYGYEVAIDKTDKAFLNEIQKVVTNRFYSYLATGELTHVETTWQMGLAMAKGLVENEFKKMNLEAGVAVAFVNVLDFYKYIGSANITTQTAFGMTYILDFMGFNVIFLCSDNEVPAGTILATPADNLIAYYVDPADSDFSRAGLEYRTDGVTNLIGFHTQGDYNTAVSECFAIMGLGLYCEYINGIAKITVEASGSIGTATFTSAAATNTTGATKITLTAPAMADDYRYYIKAASGTAPSAPDYLGSVDSTWKELTFDAEGVADDVTGLTSGHKAMLVITNGSGQAIYAAAAGVTVVVKA